MKATGSGYAVYYKRTSKDFPRFIRYYRTLEEAARIAREYEPGNFKAWIKPRPE